MKHKEGWTAKGSLQPNASSSPVADNLKKSMEAHTCIYRIVVIIE
jgi:hypothetical protein